MTEDEAKTKWCPFVRPWECGGSSWVNRPLTSPEDSGLMAADKAFCMASACMAWRTRHQWLDNAQQEPSWVSYAPYAFEPGPGQERDDGYCGIAGAPQQ